MYNNNISIGEGSMLSFLLALTPCEQPDVLQIIRIIKTIMKIICIVIPICVFIFVTIDFAKNVIASEEKDIEVNKKLALKRILMGVAVFLVPTIVMTVNNILGSLGVNYTDCLTNATEDGIGRARINYSAYQKTLELSIQKTLEASKQEKPSSGETVDRSNGFGEIKGHNTEESSDNPSSDTPSQTGSSTYSGNKISWSEVDGNKVRRFIHKMEGTTDTTCNNNTGYKVTYDTIAKSETTAYGITKKYTMNTIRSCSRLSDSEKKYFSDSNFVTNACISKNIMDKAADCIYDSHASSIVNTIKKNCGSDVKFTENQWIAIMDEANSGIGHATESFKKYCSAVKSGKNGNDALFWEYFKRKRMNPTCAYVARRDCEARLFFEGDDTCGGQSPYNANYKYKYGKYLDTSVYRITKDNTCKG